MCVSFSLFVAADFVEKNGRGSSGHVLRLCIPLFLSLARCHFIISPPGFGLPESVPVRFSFLFSPFLFYLFLFIAFLEVWYFWIFIYTFSSILLDSRDSAHSFRIFSLPLLPVFYSLLGGLEFLGRYILILFCTS